MSNSLLDHFDAGSLIVIVLTLLLFLFSILVKGFTHELLLETGVFLLSVKLILASHKNSVTTKSVEERLKNIQLLLEGLNRTS